MNQPAPYLSCVSAAQYVGLSSRTLEGLRLNGKGPVFAKLGSRVVYRRGDLDKWVEASLVTSTSDVTVKANELDARG